MLFNLVLNFKIKINFKIIFLGILLKKMNKIKLWEIFKLKSFFNNIIKINSK